MLLDAETRERTAILDPEYIEFTQAHPVPALDWSDPAGFRAGMDFVANLTLDELGPAEAAIIEEYHTIPMRDGYDSKVKVFRPATPPASGSPLIVFFFGGGWMGGSLEMNTGFARAWVRQFGATVVSPAYRLAPEHKFPVSQNDSWDSVAWSAEHAASLGANPSRGFIVGGWSAGATNAAVITHHALLEPFQHPITGQFLIIPTILSAELVPSQYKSYYTSWEQNKNAPVIDHKAAAAMAEIVAFDTTSPWRFPTLSKAPLAALPPTYQQACGVDPLRDDALIYDEMLRDAGVKTKIDLYDGSVHGHYTIGPVTTMARKALDDYIIGMGWLLGEEIQPGGGFAAYVPKA